METHRKLSLIGAILLAITIGLFYFQDDYSEENFNYTYVTGIAMVIVFAASLIIFNKNKIDESRSKSHK